MSIGPKLSATLHIHPTVRPILAGVVFSDESGRVVGHIDKEDAIKLVKEVLQLSSVDGLQQLAKWAFLEIEAREPQG